MGESTTMTGSPSTHLKHGAEFVTRVWMHGRKPWSRRSIRDQPVHAGRLRTDTRHHTGQIIGMLDRRRARTARHRPTRRRSGYAAHADASGDALAQVSIRLLQPVLRCHPGLERHLDPLQHDVERTSEPPTSVAPSAPGTRWSRFPAAIQSAVLCTSSSGRSPRRTSHQPPAKASTRAPAVTANSMSKRVCSVLSCPRYRDGHDS